MLKKLGLIALLALATVSCQVKAGYAIGVEFEGILQGDEF